MALCSTVCSTLLNWPIVSLLILFYFILFSNAFCILVHDYTLCIIDSPCCNVSYYNYTQICKPIWIKTDIDWYCFIGRDANNWGGSRGTILAFSMQVTRGSNCGSTWGTESMHSSREQLPTDSDSGWSSLYSHIYFYKRSQGTLI